MTFANMTPTTACLWRFRERKILRKRRSASRTFPMSPYALCASRYFTVTEDGTQTFRNQVKTVEFDTLNPHFDVDFSDTMKAGEVRFKASGVLFGKPMVEPTTITPHGIGRFRCHPLRQRRRLYILFDGSEQCPYRGSGSK